MCSTEDLKHSVDDALARRGPDHQGCYETTCGHFHLLFQATVLHMRGEIMETQPVVSKAGNVFIWNGEVFGGFEVS